MASMASAASSDAARAPSIPPAGASPARTAETAARWAIEAAKVMVEGPLSGPARVSRRSAPRSGSGLSRPVVIESIMGGPGISARDSASRTTSALRPDWLTITSIVAAPSTWDRKCRSSAVSICRAKTPRAASSFTAGKHASYELPMPVRTTPPASAAASASASSVGRWSVSAAAARRRASGWPAISARNGSGNFPNHFIAGSVRSVPMGVKVAVVGGGSTYTPELVEGFVRRAERFPLDELVLLDPDRERLEVVGGLAGRMLEHAGYGGRLGLTADPDAAIDGASFVIVQLRVGGQAARLLDETIPPRFG